MNDDNVTTEVSSNFSVPSCCDHSSHSTETETERLRDVDESGQLKSIERNLYPHTKRDTAKKLNNSFAVGVV